MGVYPERQKILVAKGTIAGLRARLKAPDRGRFRGSLRDQSGAIQLQTSTRFVRPGKAQSLAQPSAAHPFCFGEQPFGAGA